jgi:hypothetical protein
MNAPRERLGKNRPPPIEGPPPLPESATPPIPDEVAPMSFFEKGWAFDEDESSVDVERVPHGRNAREKLEHLDLDLSPEEMDQAVWAIHHALEHNRQKNVLEKQFLGLLKDKVERELSGQLKSEQKKRTPDAERIAALQDLRGSLESTILKYFESKRSLVKRSHQTLGDILTYIHVAPGEFSANPHIISDETPPLSDSDMRFSVWADIKKGGDVMKLIDAETQQAMITERKMEKGDKSYGTRWLQVDGESLSQLIHDTKYRVNPSNYFLSVARIASAADEDRTNYWIRYTPQPSSLPKGVVGAIDHYRLKPTTASGALTYQRVSGITAETSSQSLAAMIAEIEHSEETAQMDGLENNLRAYKQHPTESKLREILFQCADLLGVAKYSQQKQNKTIIVKRLIRPLIDMYVKGDLPFDDIRETISLHRYDIQHDEGDEETQRSSKPVKPIPPIGASRKRLQATPRTVAENIDKQSKDDTIEMFPKKIGDVFTLRPHEEEILSAAVNKVKDGILGVMQKTMLHDGTKPKESKAG